jgi:hypothetical protein
MPINRTINLRKIDNQDLGGSEIPQLVWLCVIRLHNIRLRHTVMTLITPKSKAKQELFINKPTSDGGKKIS